MSRVRHLWTVLGLAVMVIWAFPVYWMATTAIKPGKDMYTSTPQLFPHHITFDNFRHVLDDGSFWLTARNSLIVSICAVALSMVVAFLAAVAVARFRFHGRRAFLLTVMVMQMVPHIALVIPIFLALSDVGLADRLPGLVITYLAFALPFAIWTVRGFVAGVPAELEEAAMMDGCSRMGAFLRVTLPLVLPGLVATSIYTMILAWNEYLMAYFIISSPDKYTLPLWLTHFVGIEGTSFGPLMAGATVISLPVAIFFMLVQRNLARGLTAGAVKS